MDEVRGQASQLDTELPDRKRPGMRMRFAKVQTQLWTVTMSAGGRNWLDWTAASGGHGLCVTMARHALAVPWCLSKPLCAFGVFVGSKYYVYRVETMCI